MNHDDQARQKVLQEKFDAHASDASKPALTSDEQTELKALKDK